jgi:hypothetical protein
LNFVISQQHGWKNKFPRTALYLISYEQHKIIKKKG